MYNCVHLWYDTDDLVFTLRKSEDQEIDLDPEQLTKITQKERNISPARGDSMLRLTTNLETLTHMDCEQAKFARTVDIGQFIITNDFLWIQLTFLCKECSERRNSQSSRLRAILVDT